MQRKIIRIIAQIASTALLFIVIWMGMGLINWMNLFELKKNIQTTEEKLGNLYWDIIKRGETEVFDGNLTMPIDSLVKHLCTSNNIDFNTIKTHLVAKDEINAFALPDNHLVIYTGLITECEHADELAGVVAHEIAHMQKNHIMQKLTREIGLTALLSMTTGKSSGEIIKQATKLLTSSAYDRNMEREADLTAVEYLQKARINAHPFANFMFRLSSKAQLPKQLIWLSTHPDSEERALDISIKANETLATESKEIITPFQWENMRSCISSIYPQ
jgi:predicted Zn-dependent protease